MNLPVVNAIVIEDLLELRATSRHHDVGRSRRRKFPAIDVGVVQKIHTVDHDALLGRWLARQHSRAIRDARVFLNHIVARAGWRVVAVGPNRRTWIVRK